ncbi:hypothetical protein R1sor_006184 [Riccia sorocarpa]|uniref:DUF7869 domain-containing protein n=1 Tax=Riccia sorocarpa TaxID=122646 RepID=A0ABD3HMB4_9MARC
MMAFCSELVARGCCKTITMYFLVGHTHEDVDAFFSKVNATQTGKSIESLSHFLAEVYNAQSSKTYPRLLQEVADYKRHVVDYVVKIEGQSAPVAFKFWMRDNMPVYQAKKVEVSGFRFFRNYIKYKEELQVGTEPNTDTFFEDQCLIQHCRNVADVIQAGWRSDEESVLQEGFWPISDYGASYKVPSQTSAD